MLSSSFASRGARESGRSQAAIDAPAHMVPVYQAMQDKTSAWAGEEIGPTEKDQLFNHVRPITPWFCSFAHNGCRCRARAAAAEASCARTSPPARPTDESFATPRRHRRSLIHRLLRRYLSAAQAPKKGPRVPNAKIPSCGPERLEKRRPAAVRR